MPEKSEGFAVFSEIIEVGIVAVKNDQIYDKYSSLLRQSVSLSCRNAVNLSRHHTGTSG